ncbi:MAG: YlbF family regulator [Lachnospiraceae bacterium]|nr:YlbF family regulator [Lachnospiraceae bacterium]
MLSDKMTKTVKIVTDAVMETEEYIEFEKQKKNVRASSESKRLIERARDIQNRLTELPEDERNNDYAESLQEEYEDIMENSAVYEYSKAESAFVTMLQEALGMIIESVDLDI